jgi:hypothetical protein
VPIFCARCNPLEDFKLLYGTGTIRLNDETRKVDWKRSLALTIKGGVIYDAAELLKRAWLDHGSARPAWDRWRSSR